jgi:hypothetical protein
LRSNGWGRFGVSWILWTFFRSRFEAKVFAQAGLRYINSEDILVSRLVVWVFGSIRHFLGGGAELLWWLVFVVGFDGIFPLHQTVFLAERLLIAVLGLQTSRNGIFSEMGWYMVAHFFSLFVLKEAF